MIGKVCQKCNVPSMIVHSRLVQEFKTKIWRLNQALAKAKTQGVNGLKKLVRVQLPMGNSSFWQHACLEQMSRLRGQFFGMISSNYLLLYIYSIEKLLNKVCQYSLENVCLVLPLNNWLPVVAHTTECSPLGLNYLLKTSLTGFLTSFVRHFKSSNPTVIIFSVTFKLSP